MKEILPITSLLDVHKGEQNNQKRRERLPGNLSKGKTASFTATWRSSGSLSNPISESVWPLIKRLAYFATGCPIAFATKGTVLEARGFASIMYTCNVFRMIYLLT